MLLLCAYCYASGDFIPSPEHTSSFAPDTNIDISWIKKLFDNFHAVQTGTLYRCSQLSSQRLKRYIKRLGIKTIINLRGTNQNKQWWRDEYALAKDFNLHFYNIAMNSKTLPSKENLLKLLSIYENAPRPILLHCYSGSDRTGEASALWVIEQQKKTRAEALKHLAFRYGHIPMRKPAKQFLINLWESKDWLIHSYNPDNYPCYR